MESLVAFLFDFDDTLLATRSNRLPALIKAASDFGYSISSKQVARHWGKPFDSLVKNLLPTVKYEAFHAHYSEVMRSFPPMAEPGAREMLAMLYRRGAAIFVISSGSAPLVRQDLEQIGLWHYVSKLWGWEDTVFHKPDPRTIAPVLKALSEKNIKAENTLYIGDSTADLKVALAHKMPFCAVLTGAHPRSAFESAGLKRLYIVETLADLIIPGSWLMNAIPDQSLDTVDAPH